MQTLLPPAPATASTRFTGLPLLSLLPLLLLFFFLFFFLSLFLFFPLFFSFLCLSSFYIFLFFSPSFPPLIFLVTLLEGARKGIINSYQHFY
jgi:hypothetical protein